MNAATTLKPENAVALQVVVSGPGGWTTSRALQANDTITVGSKAGCGLRLEGQSISPIHCLLQTVNGALFIQDWCSSTGTLLNGVAVSEATPVALDAEIRLGDFRIACRPQSRIAEPEDQLPTSEWLPPDVAADPSSHADAWWSVERAGDADSGDADSRDVDSGDVDSGDAEFDRWDASPESWAGEAGGCTRSMDEETIDLLKYEIELLQHEVAQRDHRISEFEQQNMAAQTAEAAAPESPAEIARLATRLEELLDELDRSDSRITQLQELLRCSEEATQAERNERKQLEAWVVDIEQRIGQRESEWAAERDALERGLKDLATQPATWPAAASSSDASRDMRDSEQLRELERLRADNRALQEKLEELRKDPAEQSNNAISPAETSFPAALREEQIRMAQERAALARQQAELANARAELQRLADLRQREECLGDARLRAFRDHLREIHVQEQQQKPADRSLGARLAQIWHRLEGR